MSSSNTSPSSNLKASSSSSSSTPSSSSTQPKKYGKIQFISPEEVQKLQHQQKQQQIQRQQQNKTDQQDKPPITNSNGMNDTTNRSSPQSHSPHPPTHTHGDTSASSSPQSHSPHPPTHTHGGTSASSSSSSSSPASSSSAMGIDLPPNIPRPNEPSPIVSLVVGMAGSGKSTLMEHIITHYNKYYHHTNQPSQQQQHPTNDPSNQSQPPQPQPHPMKPYSINLDPAVLSLSYQPNIDIRDTVKYKDVMKEYGLGPNGGILTSLNLFATRFDQVLSLTEKRKSTLKHIFVDTPGQIEVFTWSASGMIITESLSQSFPTCLLYIVDTPRNLSPTTFMSNMLYACSIMYKTQLPFLLVLNKIDVADSSMIERWMNDYDAMNETLKREEHNESYITSLTRSMSLVLHEFYSTINVVSVSSLTGQGFDKLFTAIEKCKVEYYNEYLPLLIEKFRKRQELDREKKEQSLARLQNDLRKSKGQKTVLSHTPAQQMTNDVDNDEDEYDGESADVNAYGSKEEQEREKREYEEFMRKLRVTDELQSKREQQKEQRKRQENKR